MSEGLIPFRDRLQVGCQVRFGVFGSCRLWFVVCGSVGCEDTLGDYCQCTGASGSGSGLCVAWRWRLGMAGCAMPKADELSFGESESCTRRHRVTVTEGKTTGCTS